MKTRIWLLALPLVGCLAVAPAGADDEKTEKKKHLKVMVVGDEDCREGRGFEVEMVEDDDGSRKVVRRRFGCGPRGFLGVHLVSLTPELRRHYSGDEDGGVLIGKVEKDSPASRAGIKVGDVLVMVDGEKVRSAMKIGRLIGAKKKGDQVELRVMRAGASRDLKATLDEHKRPSVDVGKFLRIGEEGDFDFDFQFDPGDFEEMIDAEVFEKLSDPIMKKKIKILKRYNDMEKKLERKLKKVEERLKKLEKKFQGKLHKIGKPGTTT